MNAVTSSLCFGLLIVTVKQAVVVHGQHVLSKAMLLCLCLNTCLH